ncbi:glycosyltransferase family 4 protein [Aquabacterium sp.]|uniref:glycosyltransferase family 4 protein n=1 Tax=Aquabacterium sp. TaxID=1872578 RepID=UPI003D6C8CC5
MREPLRIALISEHASPLATMGGTDAGGQNIYVAQVARCLAKAGHQVDVFTRRDNPDLPPVVDLRPGARVIHINAGDPTFIPKEKLLGHMPEFARSTERLFRIGQPYDVVHANFFMSGLVAQRLKSTTCTPFVITFHALGLVRQQHQKEADTFPLARISIERNLVKRADAIIAECPQDQHDLLSLYGARPSSLAMVPCGFDASEFGPMNRGKARKALDLAEHEFVILQLGRLVPRKGIDNVIRSLAHLNAAIPARLLIVGGDAHEPDEVATPEIARLRQIAHEAGVADKVTFIGHRQRHELRPFYAAANVFVTTPWYEPFGITPLEAMASGIPVVASAVGGLQYSVVDGVTGFHVPPHNPAALGARLEELFHNPSLAEGLGMGGLRRARAMFTWERVTEQLTEVYESVLQPRELPHIPAAHGLHLVGMPAANAASMATP